MRKAIANINFFDKKNGGRNTPIFPSQFKCPLFFKNIEALSYHGYDCRMLINEYGKKILPGETVNNIPMIFLSSEEVFSHITIGTEFYVWEGRNIGEGIIIAII